VGKGSKAGAADYSRRRAAKFCAALAAGASTEAAAQALGVSTVTVFEWLAQHEEFAAMKRAAHRARTFALAEEMLRIADTPLMGSQTKTRGDVTETVEVDMTAHRKLQIDTRKWLLTNLEAQDLAERAQAAAGCAPAERQVLVLSAEPMTEEEWQERYGADLGAADGAAEGPD
jgi:transposase